MALDKQEKRITSVKTFVDEIMRLKMEIPIENAEQWFFRGQKNASWDVRPSIYRNDCLSSEHFVIERAKIQNPVEFRDCITNYEILTKLQHYGLGTRLLDVTLNPLVALFFATEYSQEYSKNNNGQFSLQEHDGKVYYRFVRGCALRDVQTRITLSIPFVEFGKSLSLEAYCKRLVDDDVISQAEHDRLSSNDYEGMIELLQTNSFIISTNSNIRLIQQRGAFLISPSVNIRTNTDIKTSLLSKAKTNLSDEFQGSILISARDKERIREELDFFNVNEATLFPELEHQMRYIQTQTKLSVGNIEEYSRYVRKDNVKTPDYTPVSRDNVERIVANVLSFLDEESKREVIDYIKDEIEVVDWNKKESVLSGIRRTVTKNLSNKLLGID